MAIKKVTNTYYHNNKLSNMFVRKDGYCAVIGENSNFYTWSQHDGKMYSSDWITGDINLHSRIINSKPADFDQYCIEMSTIFKGNMK